MNWFEEMLSLALMNYALHLQVSRLRAQVSVMVRVSNG